MSKQEVMPARPVNQSLIAKVAGKYSVEPEKMLATLKETVFKNATNEQLCALLVVADQYGLNPWTKEIYAFPAQGGIVPVVGVDGWISILNRQVSLQAVEFKYSEGENEAGVPDWIECIITRSDRTAPTTAREYFEECRRDTGPWKSHPRRMLRHKALVQAARISYGFSGIYDEDEAERIIEGVAAEVKSAKPATERPVEKIEHQAETESMLPAQEAADGEARPPIKLARPNQLKLLRDVIAKHDTDEDRVCAHFDVAALEELEFETVDLALAFVKSKAKLA